MVQDQIDKAKVENDELEEEIQMKCFKQQMDVLTQEIVSLKDKIKSD